MSVNHAPRKSSSLLSFKESALRKFLNYSCDEFFVVDREGKVIYVNEACERHYGLKPEEMIGKSVFEFSNAGYYFPCLIPFVFKERRMMTMEQMTRYGKKLIVTATPVFAPDGEIEYVVMNSRDITEIKSLKYDLEEYQEQREKQDQKTLNESQKNSAANKLIVFSEGMKKCVDIASKVAAVDTTVLITGESGTGKNVLANYIHQLSPRCKGPLICINCATIPAHLLESELFGYCKGAFTGASSYGKIGLVELADKGTLFLDEISEIPIDLQAKLLELIEENSFIPIGGKTHKKIDIRIIAATNRNLADLVAKGEFREDLFYRLNIVDIFLPPLRERQEDIMPIFNHFLTIYDQKYKKTHILSKEVNRFLLNYSWPGNVRELKNLAERLAITVSDNVILPCHLPPNMQQIFDDKPAKNDQISIDDIETYISLKEKEKKIIVELYKKLQSTYKVAEALQISQSKVARIVRAYLKESDC